MRFLVLLVILALSFLNGANLHAEPDAIQVTSGMDIVNVTRSLETLSDPERKILYQDLTASSSQFEKVTKDAVNNSLGYQWYRGVFENKSLAPVTVLLQFDLASHVQLNFIPGDSSNTQTFESGWKTSFNQHSLKSLQPTLKISVPPGQSKFIMKTEGKIFSLNIGSESIISEKNNQIEMWFVFSLGTFLSLGVFNFFLFLRTRDTAYLIYSVRCVIIGVLGGVTFNAWAKYVLDDSIFNRDSWGASLVSINVLTWLYITRKFLSLERLVEKRVLNVSFYLLATSLLVAAAHAWIFTAGDAFFLVRRVTSAAFLWMLGMGIFACIKRSRPAYFFMPATAVYLAGVFIIILATEGVITSTALTSLAPSFFGTLEALLMSFGLGDKYMTAMRAEKAALADRNVELGRDLSFMQKSLNQGIFSIDQQGRISLEHSDYLKRLLGNGEEKVGGKDAFQLMFEHTDMSKDLKNQIRNAVLLGIEEDSIFFEMNEHILPREITRYLADKVQILEVDWQPLLNQNGKCDKMMVVLRDVSDLRALQKETLTNQRSLKIIAQIHKATLQNYEKFAKNASELIGKNLSNIVENKLTDSIDLEMIYRNVHTVKGNARTFGFFFISDIAHDTENYLSDLRSGRKTIPDYDRLLREMGQLSSILKEYDSVASSWLKTMTHDQGFELLEKLNELYELHSNESEVKERFFSLATQERLKRYFPTVCEMLSPIIRNQSETARALSRPSPCIRFHGDSVRLTVAMEPILRNIFTQLLRNSVDHGSGDVAKAVEIDIKVTPLKDSLLITIEDDGPGLDLPELMNKTKSVSYDSDMELAKSIFTPGISTSRSVSHISGRGVGMDIIREEVRRQGGSLAIVFTRAKDGNGRQPFRIELSFPLDNVLKGPSEPSSTTTLISA